MAKTRRLFFALWPDTPVREQLIRTRDTLVAPNARAVADSNVHLTLAFIGNVDASLLDALIDAGGRVQAAGFAVRFDQIEKRKGMLWLVPSVIPSGLPALYELIWASVEANPGILRERRGFRPHITLARKHSSAPREDQVEPLDWRARAFSLVESVQADRVSVYRPIRTFPLG